MRHGAWHLHCRRADHVWDSYVASSNEQRSAHCKLAVTLVSNQRLQPRLQIDAETLHVEQVDATAHVAEAVRQTNNRLASQSQNVALIIPYLLNLRERTDNVKASFARWVNLLSKPHQFPLDPLCRCLA